MSFDSIGSEGGPILIGDSEAILHWRGVEDGGADYARACGVISSATVGVLSPRLVAWEFGGPGVGFIFEDGDGLSITRVWADVDWNPEMCPKIIAQAPFGEAAAHLEISSGILVFLWAPEDGSTIEEFKGDSGEPAGDFSMGGAAHFKRVENGKYAIRGAEGEFEGAQYTAIRIQRLA